jgi:DNA-binding NarL/FixJ family response regulator
MSLNILLVDDHIMITDFYKTALSDLEIETAITATNTLKTAYNLVFDINTPLFDIVILDLRMPPYLEKEINSGEDLANLIRIQYPKIKIVIITGHCEQIRLNNIRQNISPEGILEKCDIDYDIFLEAFTLIIKGNTYLSETIKKAINTNFGKIYFDNVNRKIINLISQGVKTKNIPQHLPLTLSGVNKRKQRIKELLQIDLGDDEDIIRKCKEIGVI